MICFILSKTLSVARYIFFPVTSLESRTSMSFALVWRAHMPSAVGYDFFCGYDNI